MFTESAPERYAALMTERVIDVVDEETMPE